MKGEIASNIMIVRIVGLKIVNNMFTHYGKLYVFTLINTKKKTGRKFTGVETEITSSSRRLFPLIFISFLYLSIFFKTTHLAFIIRKK